MKKIGIIGAGVFGCSAAIELAKRGYDVTIIERTASIFEGASTNNHLRHHYGYHYPRSKETALESIKARDAFEKEYYGCVISGFPAYYALAKEESKSTPDEFMKFCDDLGLKYEKVDPDPKIFNVEKITLCLKTPEPAYDPIILKNIIEHKIKEFSIILQLRSEVIGGKILSNGKKMLKIKDKGEIREEIFDFVVSAIYSNFNKINVWFGFPKEKFRYDLMELLDMELPIKDRFGAMVVDGDFSTFVPSGPNGIVRLGHVREVRIKTIVSEDLDADSLIKENKITKKEDILRESIKFYPILRYAKYVKSIFIVRIVKAGVESTDSRPSEITEHKKGIFSIFGGKVITCVETAKKIADKIDSEA